MKKCIDFNTIKDQWIKELEFIQEYEALELEYAISLELIKARSDAGLTQEEVARRMGTTQPVIARLESGNIHPSVKTLSKYASATGKSLEVHLN